MSKKCARCEKIVYPVEELRCLDKTWHKVCFRCFECGMMLNMKNYKGYSKQPYCEAHYPKVKHTQVADTPENARLAQNTKLQSQARYHEEFEKQKGHKITVVDDPETVRARKNMEISSQVAYTGLMHKHADMEARRPMMEQDSQPQNMTGQGGYPQGVAPPPQPQKPQQPQQPQPQPPPPKQQQVHEAKPSPYASRNQGQTTVYNAGGRGKVEHHPPSQRVGSIADYDPMNDNYGSIIKPGYPQPQQQQQHHQQRVPQQHQQRLPQQHQQPQYHQQQQQYRKEPEPSAPAPQHHHPQQPQQSQGPRYQAMYDYESADADEVSFREGDIIINTESIDEGWMTGTVQRTRQTGMLPANYVQRVS